MRCRLQVKLGTADEIASRAQAGMLPIFRSQLSFVAYESLTTNVNTVISISFWQTHE